MPVITTLIAIAGVAASIGGVLSARAAAAKAAKAAALQAKKARAALLAKKPSDETRAKLKLIAKDKELKRGKGSLAQRKRKLAIGGLPVTSASEVGGL